MEDLLSFINDTDRIYTFLFLIMQLSLLKQKQKLIKGYMCGFSCSSFNICILSKARSVVGLLFQKQFRTEAYRSILWLVNDDNISKGNRSPL